MERELTNEEVMARFKFRIGHLNRLSKIDPDSEDVGPMFAVFAHTVGMTPEEFDELDAEIIGDISERVAQAAQRLTGKVQSLNLIERSKP